MAVKATSPAKLGTSDQHLADYVLESGKQSLKYAIDARTWIIKSRDVWETSESGAGDLIAAMWHTLPDGKPEDDPGIDKTSDDGKALIAQYRQKVRLASDSGASAVARKMARICGGTAIGDMEGMRGLSVRLADLDQNPEIIWLLGHQAYDIRHSTYPAMNDPHMHCTRYSLPTGYPGSNTPLWDAFVEAVWPDKKVRDWALTVLSVGFTGYADRVLPILAGPTSTGKTSLVSCLADLLGTYGLGAADPRLLSSADRAHASIVYALRGARLAFIDEAPRTGQAAQERLKQLTGGADLTGNRMGENPVTFAPTHSLILTANPGHEPELTDDATAARVRLLPCTGDVGMVRAARAALGPLRGRAWQQEAPYVLAVMLRYAAGYLAAPDCINNSNAPWQVKAYTAETATDQDTVLAWHAGYEWDEFGTRARQLHADYVVYCKEHNVPAGQILNETLFGKRLTKMGYPARDGHGGKRRPLMERRLNHGQPKPDNLVGYPHDQAYSQN